MREIFDIAEEKLKYLETKKKIFLFLIIVTLIGTIFYFFLIEPLLKDIEDKKVKIANLEKKIDKISLKRLEAKIKRLEKEYLKQKTRLNEIKTKTLSLKSKLDKMDFLFPDMEGIGHFIDYLLEKSLKHRIKVYSVEIDESNEKFIGKLFIKKVIKIEGEGSFLNIVPFVRSLEAKRLLIRVRDYNISLNEGVLPQFLITIEIFGVN